MMEPTKPGHPAREAVPAREPAVDAGALVELRDLHSGEEAGALPELIEMLLADAESQLASLRETVREGNAPAVAWAAHALKGSCAIVGARPMARICGSLEDQARAADLANAPELLVRLDAEYARVRIALQRELSKG